MASNLPTDTSQARGLRDTIARPLLQGGPECLLDGLLCRVEVAENAYQRCQDSSRLVAIDPGYLFARCLRRIHPGYPPR